MGWRISILAAWSLILSAGSAAALPGDDYLANWGQGGLGIIQDGTSNTIQFGETSQFDICFDNVGVPGGIVGGSISTIRFGSNSGVFVVPGAAGPRVPIGTITDGSSNTIFFGESLCLNDVVIGDPPPGGIEDGTSNTIIIGEGSRFDICFSNVTQQITDGTSNTILLGESVCFEDLRVAAVPEPHAAALAFAALLAAVPYGRRKSIRRAAAAFRR
jgi:hypothetical protein